MVFECLFISHTLQSADTLKRLQVIDHLVLVLRCKQTSGRGHNLESRGKDIEGYIRIPIEHSYLWQCVVYAAIVFCTIRHFNNYFLQCFFTEYDFPGMDKLYT